jgi:hypothetical protein
MDRSNGDFTAKKVVQTLNVDSVPHFDLQSLLEITLLSAESSLSGGAFR